MVCLLYLSFFCVNIDVCYCWTWPERTIEYRNNSEMAINDTREINSNQQQYDESAGTFAAMDGLFNNNSLIGGMEDFNTELMNAFKESEQESSDEDCEEERDDEEDEDRNNGDDAEEDEYMEEGGEFSDQADGERGDGTEGDDDEEQSSNSGVGPLNGIDHIDTHLLYAIIFLNDNDSISFILFFFFKF